MMNAGLRMQHPINRWAITISLLALAVSAISLMTRSSTSQRNELVVRGLVDRIRNQKELHAGYGVYPPYTLEDPNTHRVSGLSVDIIEQIARELDAKVVWHRLNWDTMAADLKRGEFDVIADPIFETIPRAPEFVFSEPYALFADGIIVVESGEQRFRKLDDLDRSGVVISVGLGQGSEALLKARFRSAEIKPVAVGTDNAMIFSGILTGRADAAVADAVNAKRFADEHKGKVRAIGLEDPPAYIPAGFALRRDDSAGGEFLSTCIRYLRSTGTLSTIAKKYKLEGAILAK